MGWFLAVAWDPDDTLSWLSAAALLLVLAPWIDWWLRRLVAVVGLGCASVAAIQVGRRAFEATTFDGQFTIHGYDTDTGLLAISCGGLLVLCLVGLRHALLTTRR